MDRYFPVLDRITEEIETIEERIFAGDTSRSQIEALYTLKRKLLVLDRGDLRHELQPHAGARMGVGLSSRPGVDAGH